MGKQESALQEACVRLLRREYPRAATYRHDGGDYVGARECEKRKRLGCCVGAPDLLIVLRGHAGEGVLAVEFKTPTGVVTPTQLLAHARVQAEHGAVHVVRSEEDFERILHTHRRGPPPWPRRVLAPPAAQSEVIELSDDETPVETPRARHRRRKIQMSPAVERSPERS